jgi:murein DD-endopeptidase MepM/ murein hydrolase activator NlpD
MPRALLVLCCAIVGSTTLVVPAAAAPHPPTYRPPVEASVSDPFRPPATPYGPGNRGLEYDTPAGTPVRVAADGQVTFAGRVAAALHVTVLHRDGVRTTYSFLARIEVIAGQQVHQGDIVGFTAGRLHFGARRGDSYFDPAALFSPTALHVRLVPFDDPPGSGDAGERSAIGQLIGSIGRVAADTGAIAGWLRSDGAMVLRAGRHYTSRLSFVDASLTVLRAWQRARATSGRPCTAAGIDPPPPGGRHVAVLVAGLGSNSRSSTVDHVHTDALGYAPSDVLRFSYAGGRTPDDSDRFAMIPATSYDASETQRDLRSSGALLADLLEVVAAQASGLPIDVYAHSQGGLVVRVALLELERRHGVGWLRRLGLVATLGSPHGGADLATAVNAASGTPAGSGALDVFSVLTDQELDHDATSIGQLAETSDLVSELARHPVPDGVDAVSIAARGDLIVPAPRSAAPGMEEVVVPLTGLSAHSDLPGSPEATRELALALAGLPPGCRSLREALLDQGTGEAISLAEDLAGAIGLVMAT